MSEKISEERARQLFAEYARTKDVVVRNEIAENYLYIAQILAKKFLGRGVDYEDLLQVASVALVKAIERFDPERGIKFSSFAAPSIAGEIKNYFRDKTRFMHISRRDSEQLLALTDARDALQKQMGAYTTDDLAEKMGVSQERVLELLEMQRAGSISSLESLLGDGDSSTVAEVVGEDDKGFQEIENREYLRKAIAKLDDTERKIIHERYWKGRSQKQVAELLGVSQMHISRSEKKILAKLRQDL